ncbi:MAG: hypothetical protein Q9200_007367 [Gallowayella weberi]
MSQLSLTTTVRHEAVKLRGSDQGFPFLKLPPEIRNLIYEKCLVVEGIINPYPVCYQEQHVVLRGQIRPSVALLRVSKQVACEARAILYGKNTWQLNQGASFYHPDRLVTTPKPFWGRFMEYGFHYKVGHVMVSFDFRDIDQNSLVSIYSSRYWAEVLSQPGSHSEAVRSQNAHDNRCVLLSAIWLHKIEVLTFLVTSKRPIERLTLDLSNCYCPGGCCRLATWVLRMLKSTTYVRDAFRSAYIKRLQRTKPTITGLLNESEKKYFLDEGFPPAVIA